LATTWNNLGTRDRWLRLGGVALAYIASGLASVALNVPPGEALLIWPPAGVALGAVICFGWRACWAIWPAALLVATFMTTLSLEQDFQPAHLGIGAGAATAASLQALVGWWIARRTIPAAAIFDRPTAIVWLLLTAGLAAAFGMLMGGLAVWLAGVLPASEAPLQLLIWWLRDLAGIVLVTPLALAWRDGLIGSGRRWVASVAAPVLLVLCATLGAFDYARDRLSDERQLIFERRAAVVARSVERSFEVAEASIASMRGLIEASPGLDARQFGAFTRPILGSTPDLAALVWLPEPGDLSRGHFVSTQPGLSVPPLDQLEQLPPVSQVLANARDSAQSVASSPVAIEALGDRETLVIGRAVYAGSPTSASERRAAMRGHVVAIVSIGHVLDDLMREAEREGLDFRLTVRDLSGETHVLSSATSQPRVPGALTWSATLSIVNQTWHLEVYSSLVYEAGMSFWGPASVLIFGTLVTGLLQLLLLSATGYTKRIERIVEERTAELREAKEAADSVSHTKSMFLANMSHEIRTPMTAIIGFTDLLLERGHDERERNEWTRTIRRSADHLLELLNDVLDVSKIEARRMNVESISTSPWLAVDEVMSLMGERARAKGLHCEAVWIGPVPELVQTDPLRLRQILVNLVGNAIKFTESGSVLLVTQLVERTGGSFLQFEVTDSGIGIPAAQLPGLFSAFTQADTSTTRRFGGSGLGLRISKTLAELLGGDIEVESREQQGSTFRVLIPVGDLSELRLIDASDKGHVEEPRETRTIDITLDCRVLVVEDHAANQRLVRHILERAGARVAVVGSGQEALDRFDSAEPEPDVILMDLMMPGMDGLTATRSLRARGYTGPIVALTADIMHETRERCIEAGCTEYLPKPVERKRLLELLRRLV
jgi:signal transduction histidine kinase